MIIDQGKVVYAEKEPGREVTVSQIRPLPMLRSRSLLGVFGIDSKWLWSCPAPGISGIMQPFSVGIGCSAWNTRVLSLLQFILRG